MTGIEDPHDKLLLVRDKNLHKRPNWSCSGDKNNHKPPNWSCSVLASHPSPLTALGSGDKKEFKGQEWLRFGAVV